MPRGERAGHQLQTSEGHSGEVRAGVNSGSGRQSVGEVGGELPGSQYHFNLKKSFLRCELAALPYAAVTGLAAPRPGSGFGRD